MSSDWKEVKLCDVVDILGDGLHGTPKYDNNGEYYFINGNNLNKNIVVDDTTKKVNYEEYLKYKKELNERTILLSINGTIGKIALYNGEKVVLGKSACYFNVKTGVDKFFVMYTMMTDQFKQYSQNYATGTTIKNLGLKQIREFQFGLPPLPEQRAIAATLSALDDKIELNNRINKTLEEMAQALFKQWFVDFEFPDENGQPYKSSGGEMEESELGPIPKGWKVSGLGEIIETVNGFSYKGSDIKESVNAMMTIKNFNRNGGLNAVGFKEIEISERVKDKHHVDLFDVVVACTDITQKADIIGNPVLVLTKGKYRKIVISMDLVKVIVKHPFISSCLIYMFLKDIRFKQQALGYTSGTTVLHLNKMVFSDYPIIIPEDEKLLEKMSFIIEPIFHLIGMTIDNSQNLTSLRDALLPKLMSGEIRVPIEEVTADV